MKNEVNDVLIENFVSLQHIITNLAEKINKLSENLSQLVSIFVSAAKSFEQNQPVKDDELLRRLDVIADQNRIIARGISIIEERTRESQDVESEPRPLPRF